MHKSKNKLTKQRGFYMEEENKTTIEKPTETQPTMVAEKKPEKQPKLSKDVKENKNIAWLAYLLFFIPLLINKTSPFVRHHANEGLEINIVDFVAAVLLILGATLPTAVAWVGLLTIIFSVIGVVLLVLTTVTKVYMIVSTLHGKAVSTPWMWDLRIIK